MRCLVTGAAGFIGSHLSIRLCAEGHEVVGLDDLSEGSLDNLAEVPEVTFVEGDLRDEAAVKKAARGCDVIFHQGAVRSVPRSMTVPGLTTEVNVVGTLNVLLAAQEQSARVVSASSSSVYGDQERFPLEESMMPMPRSPYATSKLAGEVYCSSWWRSFGTPAISLRYFNVYGPRQDPSSDYATVVPRFVLACMKGERPVIHDDGHQARDFTYIDDAVTANLLAAQAPTEACGRAFNIGGGRKPTSVNELLALIADLTGSQPEPVYTERRPGDVRLTEADVSLAGRLLGYRPAVGIEDGLARSVAWFRDHFPAASRRS
jgi:nucleoside-diphosphate-sugar epimerase